MKSVSPSFLMGRYAASADVSFMQVLAGFAQPLTNVLKRRPMGKTLTAAHNASLSSLPTRTGNRSKIAYFNGGNHNDHNDRAGYRKDPRKPPK